MLIQSSLFLDDRQFKSFVQTKAGFEFLSAAQQQTSGSCQWPSGAVGIDGLRAADGQTGSVRISREST